MIECEIAGSAGAVVCFRFTVPDNVWIMALTCLFSIFTTLIALIALIDYLFTSLANPVEVLSSGEQFNDDPERILYLC